MPKFTPDKERKILEIYDKTLEYKATAQKAGVSESAVRKIVKKYRPTTVESEISTVAAVRSQP
jgi:transposase